MCSQPGVGSLEEDPFKGVRCFALEEDMRTDARVPRQD
jgi:hypothetical protein